MKTILLLIMVSFSSSTFASDPISTAKMLGVLMSQLKELKEVLEVSNKTFEEVEKVNRKVQDNRLRILRMQNIVETTKGLANGNYKGIEGTTKLIRRSKNIVKDSKSLGGELVDDLSQEEIDGVAEKLAEMDSEYKQLSERIKILQRERASLLTKTGSTLKQSDIVIGLGAERESRLLESQAMDMAVSPSTAQTLTAKNTALANKINIQNSKVLSQSLEVQQGLLDHIKKDEINRLKEEENRKKMWGIKK